MGLALPASALQLNGLAIHSELRSDYYVGALYVDRVTSDSAAILQGSQNRRIVMRILAPSWSARGFQQHWSQSILINNDAAQIERQADNILAFTEAIKGPLVSGDELVLDCNGQGQAQLNLNGATLFATEKNGAAFFNTVVNAWVGQRPPSTQFKREILAGGARATQSKAIFDALQPAPGRDALAASWAPLTAEQQAEAENKAAAEKAAAKKKQLARAKARNKQVAVPFNELASTRALQTQASRDNTAPQPGAAPRPATSSVDIANYRSAVLQQVYKEVRYPRTAVARGYSGDVSLELQLARDGKLLRLDIIKPAGHDSLNKAAVRAVERAAPFPELAELDSSSNSLLLKLPIKFRLD